MPRPVRTGDNHPSGVLAELGVESESRPARSEPPSGKFQEFWDRRAMRHILMGVVAFFLVIALGTLGYVALGWNFSDAFFMVMITVSTVGYGEIQPISSDLARAHTIVVIMLGSVALAYMLGGFVQLLTEGEIQKYVGQHRMQRTIETMSDHTIIVGFGRVGMLVCKDMASLGLPFLIIDQSTDRLPEIERLGYPYLVGDATEEKTLNDAGLARAKVIVSAMPSDANNVFITLTARQMAPNVKIVARAEQPSTQKKLIQAGANHVILPAVIGARRIVSLLTNPTAVEFAELVTQRSTLEIEMDDIPVSATSPLKGVSLRHADIGRRTGVIVIAIKRADGRVEFPPTGDEPFAEGDNIVILGRRSNLSQFRTQF